jgi:hypothetical protein
VDPAVSPLENPGRFDELTGIQGVPDRHDISEQASVFPTGNLLNDPQHPDPGQVADRARKPHGGFEGEGRGEYDVAHRGPCSTKTADVGATMQV